MDAWQGVIQISSSLWLWLEVALNLCRLMRKFWSRTWNLLLRSTLSVLTSLLVVKLLYVYSEGLMLQLTNTNVRLPENIPERFSSESTAKFTKRSVKLGTWDSGIWWLGILPNTSNQAVSTCFVRSMWERVKGNSHGSQGAPHIRTSQFLYEILNAHGVITAASCCYHITQLNQVQVLQ